MLNDMVNVKCQHKSHSVDTASIKKDFSALPVISTFITSMVASTSLDVVPDDPTAYKTQQYWEDRYQK